ncbi:hypothetical protein RHMOL_Rhmol07G0197300 [Rhododendron molle]|uniref:Uncharacterized protein n=1 Tax=Rhododendron molle TaxID=49168 RepID=A0ACC0N372_RHOML|nr:hypothetical protein RHMOL_Rhmol07G0197300 [Rhododendron molle]
MPFRLINGGWEHGLRDTMSWVHGNVADVSLHACVIYIHAVVDSVIVMWLFMG